MSTLRTQADNQQSQLNLRITILRGTLRKLMALDVFTAEEKRKGYSNINTWTDLNYLEHWVNRLQQVITDRQAQGICHTPVVERPADVEIEFEREESAYRMRTSDIVIQQAAVNHTLSALADSGLTEYERARL